MGQKTSPLALREQRNTSIITVEQNIQKYIFIKKIIINFFYKKHLLINTLSIKEDINTIKIVCTLIPMQSFYSQKNRHLNKKKKICSLQTFFKNLATLFNKKYIYFSSKSLITKNNIASIKKNANFFFSNAQKKGLKIQPFYLKLKDFFLVIFLLTEGLPIRAQTITILLAKNFPWIHKRLHKKLFNFLRDFFNYIVSANKKIKGLKFEINGRLSGKDQADSYHHVAGSINSSTFKTNIDYALKASYSKLGVFGWKLWINKQL